MNKINLHYQDLPNDVVLNGDIAIDTEAMGLQIPRDRLCLVQLCDEDRNVHLVQFRRDDNGNVNYNAKNLIALLQDSKRQKIFHYGRFDIAIMMHYFKIEKIPNIFCTKIASKLARTYTDHHGLRTIVMELCGVELKKEQQSSNWGAEELTHEQKKYAANDVIYLHEMREKLTQMLYENGRLPLAREYFSFLHTICKADLLGFLGSEIYNH
ncbi:ribonuclease D [Candidatus Deianiraea vastatrix]|uniref:Ribonuclease D n=1 Tax=Candidatus Deianiraea vastatrix TaxID=2163644 RepID=A0A5B8XBU7_9RICK|nr:ribonuclease H-like domain-containing protein [Candidatus Deianiraea vastatrix]QED22829.1 Ribonuclease D [Candidatus Deianiraea vastatrix]